MVNENVIYNILEYLQKNGVTNTFKLAHVLDIKRDILLRILKNLEEQGSVKIMTGKVEFLSYPSSKEKKKQKPKMVIPKEKSEIQTLQEEVGKLKLYIKKLEQRPPKVITKTIIKEVKPIESKQEKRRKRKKIKKSKIKPKKIPILIKIKKKLKLLKIELKKKPSLKFKQKRVKKTKKVKLRLPKLKIPKFKKIKLKKLKNEVKGFIKYLKKR